MKPLYFWAYLTRIITFHLRVFWAKLYVTSQYSQSEIPILQPFLLRPKPWDIVKI